MPLTKAAGQIDMSEVAELEFILPVKSLSTYPFNDLDFTRHWHYLNSGQKEGYVAGADINLLEAWTYTTGSKDVIVCVNDEGVKYNHEDLSANMWINEAELNGVRGVDDDENGYVDDIYGYNFVTLDGKVERGTLAPGDHGTHVAGTIAAVNNNGLGINGIAGGDSPEGNGVRIMSAQSTGGKGGYVSSSIVYAADNGSVLMNCSWGYVDVDSTPKSTVEAIEYFNKYAGYDENGIQVGPMAGGLIVFAAGNDNRSEKEYPAMDDNVLSVAAIAPNFQKASYSSYGPWVDITAPGGELNMGKSSCVYSTVLDGYDSYQGTSMAAPHVTGVAALVISQFGGPGFTREKLIYILQNTANKRLYDYNGNFVGKLGAGLVDAGAAVSLSQETPSKVTGLKASVKSNELTISWDKPEEGVSIPFTYTLYRSTQSLSSLDRADVPEDVVCTVLKGCENSIVLSDMGFETTYYFRVDAQGVFGGDSELSDQISVSTQRNNPPIIQASTPTVLTLKSHESAAIVYDVSDIDDHRLSYSIAPADEAVPLEGLSSSMKDGKLTVSIDAVRVSHFDTIFKGIVTLSDPYASTTSEFSYTVRQNHAPLLKAAFPDLVLNSTKESSEISLTDFFADEDGEALTYSANITTANIVANCSLNGDKLTVKANSYGYTDVVVKAKDAKGEVAEGTFRLLVRDGSKQIDLYPVPVEKEMNIRTPENKSLQIVVYNRTGAALVKTGSIETGPFEPYSVDMSELPGGSYYVSVKGEGLDEAVTIIKK